MNEFKRKQWTRIGLSILALAAAVLFLAGIIGGKPMTYQLGVNENAVSATEKGFGGDVTVHLEPDKDQKVKSLTIDTPDETEGLGKRASEAEFTDQFIGKTGPFTFGEDGIEAISGATITSNAALKAINRIITGEEALAETAEETPSEKTETEEKTAEEPAEETVTETPAETAAEENKTEEPAAETSPAEGQLTAAAQGFGGDVTVHLELNDDGTVKALAIDTPNETDGLGKRASEAAFTDQFIGKAGPFAYGENGIDALSGATVTSEAVLKAINSLAGGDPAEPAAEEPAEEPAAEEKKTEEPAEKTKTEQPAAEQPAEEKPAETAKAEENSASAGQVYGSYLSEKETDFSIIRVMISTKNDEITECKITSEAKSEGSDFLKDEIKAEWAKAIVEAQGTDTDVITGATLKFSAAAVTEAVAEIQAQVAGEDSAAAAEKTEEPAAEQPAEETKTEEPAAETTEETKKEEPAEEQPAEAEKVPAQYGGYLAEKETAFSTVKVLVSTSNGKITGCKVLFDAKEGQTDLVTDENEAAWAKAVVEGAEIDTVTGATISSDAVKEAVAEIMAKIR